MGESNILQGQTENIGGGAVMKQELDCMIVQDLLPNYIEKLTSDVTNHAVEEHISSCEQCNELLNIMNAEITTKKTVPKRELKFLKKIKLTRLISAVSCILLALICAYMLYTSEYKFTSDKKVLSAAITEYTSHGNSHVEDAYVLETKEIDGVLIAFFKDNKNPNIYGFAKLLKGVNMKYRLVRANYGPSSYSAVVDTYRFDTSKGAYYAVGGYNLDKNITSYGLRLYDESRSNLIEDMLKFNIENSQFLDIKKETDLQKSIKKLQGNLVFFGHDSTALLDAEGNNITKNYKISGITNTWGAGTGTAELFVLYVFIAIVLILGAIFARYFLSEK
jgi:hypothetical protein